MDDAIRLSLARNQVLDITTTGRRTGARRRIEIVDHVIDGRIYISGMPREQKRAWLANLEADPRLIVHLKQDVRADLPATARVVTDEGERRAVLQVVARNWNRTDLETMVAWSPLVEVTIEGDDESGAHGA